MNIKEFLTIDEIDNIVECCIATENVVEQRVLKDMMVVKYAMGLEDLETIDSETYDKYLQDGTIQKVYETVKNVYLVNEILSDAKSVESTMMGMSAVLSNFLKEMEDTIKDMTKGLPKSQKGWDIFISKVKSIKGTEENVNK